jgi:eukaryotic-like serine/threonine-protein kinase
MPISFGTRLGPYEIVALIGAGGMGEVYRARDPRMGREVAIKVSAERFSDRFEREVRAVAALNHPNVCQIYDVGPNYLVMELVEGPTLADRIKEGPLPLEEALPIARQIADALEAAHEKGIIHRDLKPVNIKIKPDGGVKVLDFGLAKIAEAAPAAGSPDESPTVPMGATRVGEIMGTAAYMSPEQAKGKAVNRRSDIWSFGVVLFEMLTGRQMFEGETATDILAAVMRAEPDWTMLPKDVPRRIRELLKRCLVKDDKRRLRDIGDARLDLDDAWDAKLDTTAMPPPNPLWRALPWAIAASAIVIAAWALSHRTAIDRASHEVMHFDITYPPNVEPISALKNGFGVSPDGGSVAMIGVRDGVRRLYIRRLDRPEAAEIKVTFGVNAASFSPDSASVAFVAIDGTLNRLSLSDQQRAILAQDTDLPSSVAWGSREIVYTRNGALWIVPAQGGAPHQLTVLDAARHEVLHDDPAVLPGGRTVLFTSLTTDSGTERIEAVSIDDRKRSVVIERAATPVWSPTGHLLFGRDGAVWAVPFDPKSATTSGAAVPVIPSGVVGTVRNGSLGFQLSSARTLVFVPADFDYKRVLSVGRDGSEVALDLPPNRYGNPRISPDGRRLLVESEQSVIEAFDLSRRTRVRLTAVAVATSFSTWTANGEGVVFKRFNVPFWAAADGTGKAGLVSGGLINDFPSSPGPDSDSILDVRIQPETSGDIFLMSISGKFQPKPLLVTPAYEGGAQLSPDRRWMLYQSNKTGQPEIYVRRYPAIDREWQVSEGGGVQARWSSTSREIYYRSGQRMMAVALHPSGGEPAFGKPTPLFADEYDFGQNISIANYDVTRDGRFIMLRRGTHGSSLRVVTHWTEELKQILAAGGAR